MKNIRDIKEHIRIKHKNKEMVATLLEDDEDFSEYKTSPLVLECLNIGHQTGITQSEGARVAIQNATDDAMQEVEEIDIAIEQIDREDEGSEHLDTVQELYTVPKDKTCFVIERQSSKSKKGFHATKVIPSKKVSLV